MPAHIESSSAFRSRLIDCRRVSALALMLMACGGTQPGSKTAVDRGTASERGAEGRIALRDDCDPADPAWAPTGGCRLEDGDVTFREFIALLTSPLSLSTVGHPAWRFEPSYLKAEIGETVMVQNTGGRLHTFTEVAQFGGGRVPPLNVGLIPAPECAHAADLPPGATQKVKGLGAGNHRFQCCIHPWMRALVKVKAEAD